ncbi:PucR family transcriptional regulator [Ureibacillus sp. Re31]|uniref:PucR family transcriptional regulator n=1 Tax=Ureibacillus galli TaxID=2762222 RepID=A0ABR8X9C1_9BACL|nr:PucR family transcriptional regulator [Ureibacillus galli]MBD8025910.1 PucR family transcriptional regulator [Ureibacillus galli]
MSYYSLLVRDILDNKHFHQAEVIAGSGGLHNTIKWVHVLEVSNVQKLLKGHELILTTGVSFQHQQEDFFQFVEGLIEANCAGLCIEYGAYIQKVPEAIIQLADDYHFPIIVFHEEVPFVEITQDLHTLIINHQYSMIAKLENYSQLLHKETLHAQNSEQLLKPLYEYLKIQTIYEIEGKDPIFYPNMAKKQREALLQKKSNPNHVTQFLTKPIYLFEHTYGELTLYSEEKEITEFELLILDRTITALAQLLLRDLYVDERKRKEDAKWLEEWLEGAHSESEIIQFLLAEWPSFRKTESTVLILSLPRNEKNQQLDRTYFKLNCHTVFDKKGFLSFVIERKNDFVFILLNRQDTESMKGRLEDCLVKFETSNLIEGQEMAVGKVVKDLTKVHESFKSAQDTLYIIRHVETASHFYDELYVFHLIYQMQKHTNLKEMMEELLQPLIDFDEKHNGQLVETLEVYMQSNGSKQETAKRLYIVRQTLYHRLRKIESLIGKDFMKGENRLALEWMLFARKFINRK